MANSNKCDLITFFSLTSVIQKMTTTQKLLISIRAVEIWTVQQHQLHPFLQHLNQQLASTMVIREKTDFCRINSLEFRNHYVLAISIYTYFVFVHFICDCEQNTYRHLFSLGLKYDVFMSSYLCIHLTVSYQFIFYVKICLSSYIVQRSSQYFYMMVSVSWSDIFTLYFVGLLTEFVLCIWSYDYMYHCFFPFCEFILIQQIPTYSAMMI